MNTYREEIKKLRSFVSVQANLNAWGDVNIYFKQLEDANFTSAESLKQWLIKRSELEAVLEEEMAWLYINMSCETANTAFAEAFNNFAQNIEPKAATYFNKLDKKIYESPFFTELVDTEYFVFKRQISNRLEIFREENVPIQAELQVEEQQYGQITAEMSIEHDGKEFTLQQASNLLKNKDRKLREEVFHKMYTRRLKDAQKLDTVLDRLIEKRNKIAANAGFKNYRDYKFKEMGRFDYTPTDVEEFSQTIEKTVCPVMKEVYQERKENMSLDSLRPFDLDVQVADYPDLKPFTDTDDLIQNTIACFTDIHPDFGNYLTIMKENGYLDLASRKGKAPGGFNYPLYESNIPFIFMNATENLRDLVTMVHEGGHAIHSFLSKDLELVAFKNLTSEIAELASMSMELISMEHWHFFFKDKKELVRAKVEQLESVLSILPWVAIIDAFQNWIYLNPLHTSQERCKAWTDIYKRFTPDIVNWRGLENYQEYLWQKQLHIYQVPFYYIEYAMAQLGAIAIWKNYKTDKKATIENYRKALSLGYSVPIAEVYKTAGIEFRFDVDYVINIILFVKKELDYLKTLM